MPHTQYSTVFYTFNFSVWRDPVSCVCQCTPVGSSAQLELERASGNACVLCACVFTCGGVAGVAGGERVGAGRRGVKYGPRVRRFCFSTQDRTLFHAPPMPWRTLMKPISRRRHGCAIRVLSMAPASAWNVPCPCKIMQRAGTAATGRFRRDWVAPGHGRPVGQISETGRNLPCLVRDAL